MFLRHSAARIAAMGLVLTIAATQTFAVQPQRVQYKVRTIATLTAITAAKAAALVAAALAAEAICDPAPCRPTHDLNVFANPLTNNPPPDSFKSLDEILTCLVSDTAEQTFQDALTDQWMMTNYEWAIWATVNRIAAAEKRGDEAARLAQQQHLDSLLFQYNLQAQDATANWQDLLVELGAAQNEELNLSGDRLNTLRRQGLSKEAIETMEDFGARHSDIAQVNQYIRSQLRSGLELPTTLGEVVNTFLLLNADLSDIQNCSCRCNSCPADSL